MNTARSDDRVLLVGCGILRREILHLIEKNHWPLDTMFLDSSLHCDLKRLENRLHSALSRTRDRNTIVFYGTCHPLMDQMLEAARTFRTVGQNCAEMLLGKARFTEELGNGAFFLLEDWARRWEQITFKTFGTTKVEVIREIYRGDRKYMLCLKTPCSASFETEAARVSDLTGLPLRWLSVTLGHLEMVLRVALERKLEAMS